MSIQKILLAYNFSRLDQKALAFVIDMFVHLKDADITVFHAYTPAPDIDTSAGMVTGKLKGSLSYLAQQINEQENILKTVAERLIQSGFAADRVHVVFKPRKKDIAGEIIELNSNMKFDAIVLNHRHARVTRFFSGSVSHKVVMTSKDTTVCIVS